MTANGVRCSRLCLQIATKLRFFFILRVAHNGIGSLLYVGVRDDHISVKSIWMWRVSAAASAGGSAGVTLLVVPGCQPKPGLRSKPCNDYYFISLQKSVSDYLYLMLARGEELGGATHRLEKIESMVEV